MMNYEQARSNMVDCQIHPQGVISADLLNAYETLPREQFLPEEKRGIAYIDNEIPLSDGRFLMDATTHARLVQALQLTSGHAVLDIGDSSGYSAAILSKLAGTVIALEEISGFSEKAEPVWNSLGCSNIVSFQSSMRAGLEKHAPYDAILINGAVSYVPQALLNQIKDGGRLVAVLKPQERSQGKAVLYVRSGDVFSDCVLFDSSLPYLQGFEPKHDFQL